MHGGRSDTLAQGRSLSEVDGYQPHWGLPSERDQRLLQALMENAEEKEMRTEGPVEVAESGPHDDLAAGETSPH